MTASDIYRCRDVSMWRCDVSMWRCTDVTGDVTM
jgi:hypothetical protein